ncbi:MAG TPA: carbohydrate-binding protein, partial [Clostridia bacterium]|nr:carbohydrate-binding protein [Clostridia bacterium]
SCKQNNIPYTYFLIPGRGHDWTVWKPSLWNFSQMACAAGFTEYEPAKPISAFEKIEAESYSDQSGIQAETCTDTEGGQNVGFIENGDYAVYKNVDFDTGATSFQARAASNNANGGKIEIRLDKADGTLIGTCTVAGTGGWQTWADVKCSVSGVTGKHDLYLKFIGGSDYLFNLNWFVFGKGTPTKVGDLNGDTYVDAMDFALIRMYLLGSVKDFPVENDLEAADLNNDKAIDALDFAVFKQYLLGIIKTLPYTP